MKLLLLVVLGLVAGVLCQVPDEFLVLEEAGPSDELDAGDLKAYSDKASELLRSMGKSGMVDPSTFDSFEDSPEPYTSLAKSNPDGGFQVSSDLVQLAEDAEPLDFSSKRGRRQIVSSNCVGLPLYHCPHTTRILSWFPIRYGSTVHAICFVPWAARQRVTYATCNCPSCNLTGQRNGRCRPSCYQRRRMLVFCWNFRVQRWTWQWVLRSLPQACSCSTC